MPWLAIKLFLGGALKRLWNALGAIVAHPKEAGLIALALASVWLWRGRQAARVEAARWEQAFADQKAGYEKASKEAAALALAQVKAVEARSAQLAKDNANEERALRAELGARAASNAERMRFDKICRRDPAPASPDDPAPIDPSPSPDAVILERRDYDTLIENTIRLKAAHEWGQDMLKDGLAKVPDGWPKPAFGE